MDRVAHVSQLREGCVATVPGELGLVGKRSKGWRVLLKQMAGSLQNAKKEGVLSDKRDVLTAVSLFRGAIQLLGIRRACSAMKFLNINTCGPSATKKTKKKPRKNDSSIKFTSIF